MRKAATVLNWVMLGLFGTAFLVMGIRYPSAALGSVFLSLLPYATALLAFRPGANRILIGASLLLNGFFAVVSLGYGLFGLFIGEAAKAVVALMILLPAPLMNCIVLKWAWSRARVTTVAHPTVE